MKMKAETQDRKDLLSGLTGLCGDEVPDQILIVVRSKNHSSVLIDGNSNELTHALVHTLIKTPVLEDIFMDALSQYQNYLESVNANKNSVNLKSIIKDFIDANEDFMRRRKKIE